MIVYLIQSSLTFYGIWVVYDTYGICTDAQLNSSCMVLVNRPFLLVLPARRAYLPNAAKDLRPPTASKQYLVSAGLDVRDFMAWETLL